MTRALPEPQSAEVYRRAEQYLAWNLLDKVKNAQVLPVWAEDGRSFWYRRDSDDGHAFVRVDSTTGTMSSCFDHSRLAEGLSRLDPDADIRAEALPFRWIRFDPDGDRVRFKAFGRTISADLRSYDCAVEDDAGPLLWSPDGRSALLRRHGDLFLRGSTPTQERRLTNDGEPLHAYGGYTDHFGALETIFGVRLAPAALWSPDGRFILTQRVDLRRVRDMHLVQAAPAPGAAPRHHAYRMAMPGDEHVPEIHPVVIEAASGAVIGTGRPPIPGGAAGVIDSGYAWWGSSSDKAYIVETVRGAGVLHLVEMDVPAGSCRVLLEEHSSAFITPAPTTAMTPLARVLPSRGEFIWYSQRSGWGHLYRYDLATGALRNAVTAGDFPVLALHHVDEAEGVVFFSAGGDDASDAPYQRRVGRAKLDGSELTWLTPADRHHFVAEAPPPFIALMADIPPGLGGWSPSGETFVCSESRLDSPPRTVLRSAVDGHVLSVLEESDLSPLAKGWRAPLAAKVKADDGETDLSCVIYRPSRFDPERKHPVVLLIYAGPQMACYPKGFLGSLQIPGPGTPFALAELGAVVVYVEPRGTPLRSRAFQEHAHGRLQSGGGLPDQVAALRQLCARFPWMDLDRVGVVGHSGGGYASCRAMLAYPDLFKVGVSSSGNHDQRIYIADWAETFQGLPDGDNYEGLANSELAANLKGALLLIQGELDFNVHPGHTLQLADALMAHNKDFELLFVPNGGHFNISSPYVIRRAWDHLTRHLIGRAPPEGFAIAPPSETPLLLMGQ